MKIITVPESVTVLDPKGNLIPDESGNPVVISFKLFIEGTLLVDQKFGKSMADILSAVEIKRKLTLMTDTLELENTDYDRLLAVAVEPTAGYNPAIVIQLVPFLTAIRDAK